MTAYFPEPQYRKGGSVMEIPGLVHSGLKQLLKFRFALCLVTLSP